MTTFELLLVRILPRVMQVYQVLVMYQELMGNRVKERTLKVENLKSWKHKKVLLWFNENAFVPHRWWKGK